MTSAVKFVTTEEAYAIIETLKDSDAHAGPSLRTVTGKNEKDQCVIITIGAFDDCSVTTIT